MDLGKTLDSTAIKPMEETKGKKYYPSIHISDVKGMDDLPDGEFEFTGKGRVLSMTHNKKNGTCSCEIEIMDLEPGDESEPGESLDKTLKKIESKKAMADDSEEASEPYDNSEEESQE